MTARCALHMSAVKNFESLSTSTATFPEIFNGRFYRLMLRICAQYLQFVAVPIPEIIGEHKKIWAPSGYAHDPFSPKFLMGFCSDGPCHPVNVTAKFKVRCFIRSWDIAIGVDACKCQRPWHFTWFYHVSKSVSPFSTALQAYYREQCKSGLMCIAFCASLYL